MISPLLLKSTTLVFFFRFSTLQPPIICLVIKLQGIWPEGGLLTAVEAPQSLICVLNIPTTRSGDLVHLHIWRVKMELTKRKSLHWSVRLRSIVPDSRQGCRPSERVLWYLPSLHFRTKCTNGISVPRIHFFPFFLGLGTRIRMWSVSEGSCLHNTCGFGPFPDGWRGRNRLSARFR